MLEKLLINESYYKKINPYEHEYYMNPKKIALVGKSNRRLKKILESPDIEVKKVNV